MQFFAHGADLRVGLVQLAEVLGGLLVAPERPEHVRLAEQRIGVERLVAERARGLDALLVVLERTRVLLLRAEHRAALALERADALVSTTRRT